MPAATGTSETAETAEMAAMAAMAARIVGAVVAAATAAFFLLYFGAPVGAVEAAERPTLADVGSTYVNLGVVVQCTVAATAGLGVAIRPRLGPGVVALAALPMPWLARIGVGVLDVDGPNGSLLAVLAATLALVLGVVVALSLTVAHLSPPEGGVVVTDAIAYLVGAGALWATLGVGWYRLVGGSDRFGGLLQTDTWAGRGTWLGLVLAATAVAVAVAGGGSPRRVGGVVVTALLVVEAVRRTVLSSADLLPPGATDGLGVTFALEPVLPLVVVPLLGAAAGAWLATTEGDDAHGVPAAADERGADAV